MPINRFPRTDFNKINLDWLMRKLKKVEDVTDDIGTAVEDAQQAAAEATTAAAGAVAAAGDATQAAEDAVEALSGIQDDVAQAVQTANSAQSTATGASNTAATALSRATTAQSAAQQAQTTASGALAQADLAREETAALNNRFPVSVADGGTGATTAAAARANLGLKQIVLTEYKFENLAQYTQASYYVEISGWRGIAGIPSNAEILSLTVSGWSGLGTDVNVGANNVTMYVYHTYNYTITSAAYITVRIAYAI
jgi:hypothetical protein